MDDQKSQFPPTDKELLDWQVEHIKASIKQADAGQLISHEDVKKMAAKGRSRTGKEECDIL